MIRMTDKKFLKRVVPLPTIHHSPTFQNNQHLQVTLYHVLPGSNDVYHKGFCPECVINY